MCHSVEVYEIVIFESAKCYHVECPLRINNLYRVYVITEDAINAFIRTSGAWLMINALGDATRHM